MTDLLWSASFVRAFKRKARRRPDLRERIEETLRRWLKILFIPCCAHINLAERFRERGRVA